MIILKKITFEVKNLLLNQTLAAIHKSKFAGLNVDTGNTHPDVGFNGMSGDKMKIAAPAIAYSR